MERWTGARLAAIGLVAALTAWLAAPALAGWRLKSTTTTIIAYNEGISFDQTLHNFFFDGVSSTTNSGLYRTNSGLSLEAARSSVIPSTKEGYNHTGDLSFDPRNRRVLLPLECYYLSRNPANTCGTGAIGVADPGSLRFRYYVNLSRQQIQKAMWAEISPDSRWIWTSSGTHLLVYRASDVSQATANRQRGTTSGSDLGILGKDLGAVLPTGSVTGAAFYQNSLFLALDLGTDFQVVSYKTATAPDGSPMIVQPPTLEITVRRSLSNYESEGLAVTNAVNGSYPLGGVLHWQMLPLIKLYSRILNYIPK